MIVARYGRLGAVVYSFFFHPAVLLLSLTPAVALLAVTGLARSIARRETLAYALLFLPSIAFFGLTLLLRMAPLARLLTTTGLLLLPYAGAQMDAWTSSLSSAHALRRALAVLVSAALVFAGLAFAAYTPVFPCQQKLWSVAPVSPFLPEERRVFNLLKGRWRPGAKLVQDESPYSHVLIFNLSPNVYEDWWRRPAIGDLPTPEARLNYLAASVPGLAVFDARCTDLSRLLNVPTARFSSLPGVAITPIYSSPMYLVYELAPRAPGASPR
jgi:hypothetical protein